MIGIIFAAGIGTRLKPFTDRHPKALAPLGGVPALVRVARKLIDAGARGLIVNVHHFPGQIRECIQAQPFAHMVEISDESELLLDTGGALVKIARESRLFRSLDDGEQVMVHNADIYTDFDMADMCRAQASAVSDATILVDPARESTRHFLFDSDGRLCGWENTAKGITRPDGLDTAGLTAAAFGGVHVMPASTVRRIAAMAPTTVESFSITDWYIKLCRSEHIAAFTPAHPYRWHDIGTPEKLAAAQACF